jgi:ABC-type sugar transport system ATPase subunit
LAEIRLENVTKIFKPGSGWMMSHNLARRAYADYQDKDFVERVIANAETSRPTEGPVRALDQLNLTIQDGETMAIVGPSGCGKSTLLRVVAGLETPDEGEVYFDGQPMHDVPAKERGIGMVFQNYALYPHFKGEGNLGFFFRVRKRPTEEMMERIRATSEIMGIGFDLLLDRKPATLSGGQQQRVAIGRCIVRDPKLFLFDEPLSNLDAKLRVSTRVEIKRLLHRFHITSIYVTHDQVEAITLGDRIAVMRAGKVEQVGTYQEITENPVTAFVAGFLGLPPMNLLRDWRVTADGHLESAMGRVPVPRALAAQVQPGQQVILGFRSGAAQVIPEGEPLPTEGLQLQGQVINCEPHFAQHRQVVNVQVGGLIFGVEAPLEMQINRGWQVHVVIPEASVYLFDQDSDRRIAPA